MLKTLLEKKPYFNPNVTLKRYIGCLGGIFYTINNFLIILGDDIEIEQDIINMKILLTF